jgi:hypothetical protein
VQKYSCAFLLFLVFSLSSVSSFGSSGSTKGGSGSPSGSAGGSLSGSYPNPSLAAGSVTTTEILNGTIIAADLATGAVTSTIILDGTIVTADMATGAVTTTNILDGTILAADLATDAVTSSAILDGTIANGDIANATIDLTTKVTGVLPVANGGTGTTTGAPTLFTPGYAPIAAAGSTISDATQITTSEVYVSAGTSGQGVKLPACVLGRHVTVIKDASINFKIYPFDGDAYFGNTANNAFGTNVDNASEFFFRCYKNAASINYWMVSKPAYIATLSNDYSQIFRLQIANDLIDQGTFSVTGNSTLTGKILFATTDSTGTPGNATVNKPSGQAKIAAAASTITITNSFLTTASIPIVVLQASDATCTQVLRVVPASGSFTATVNAACTASTQIGWYTVN